jgi:hypothetical protein
LRRVGDSTSARFIRDELNALKKALLSRLGFLEMNATPAAPGFVAPRDIRRPFDGLAH